MKKTWIKIKRGILEPKHIEKLGQAWYLYFYILDQADWETGTISNWKDEFAADDLCKPIGLIREHRKKLAEEKYITFNKGQHNQTIIINNWTDPRRYDFHVINPEFESSDENQLSNSQSSGQSSGQTTFEQAQNSLSSYSHISHNTLDKNKKNGYLIEYVTGFCQTMNWSESILKNDDIEIFGKLYEAGCTPHDIVQATQTLLKSDRYTITGPKSIYKTCLSTMSKRKQAQVSDYPYGELPL